MTGAQPIRSNPCDEDPENGMVDTDGFDDPQAVDLELATEQMLADQNLTQHIIRRCDDGRDTFVGYFRCQLQAQQQRYALHIPLYPPMNEIPQVEAIVMGATEATVKVTDCQRFGVRMEIVLRRPADCEISALVEVIAYSGS